MSEQSKKIFNHLKVLISLIDFVSPFAVPLRVGEAVVHERPGGRPNRLRGRGR